jgi:hypothetical protein
VVVAALVIIQTLPTLLQGLEDHLEVDLQVQLEQLLQIEVVEEEDTLGIHLVLVVLVVRVLW